jgi:hypothetical protein
MSCWVVPTIAAEIWGVGVDHILQRVRDGNLPYQVDEGFMFVDVHAPPPRPPKVEHPPTFTALSQAELEALRDAADEPPPSRHDDDDDDDEVDEAESQSPTDDEASVELGDWRAARQRVGMTRIPPGQRAKPQAA